jgi:hypothetical protein
MGTAITANFVEGAGAGGRAFLFRASNLALAKFYSKVGNSPHANVFGNDIFKLGLIKRYSFLYCNRELDPSTRFEKPPILNSIDHCSSSSSS